MKYIFLCVAACFFFRSAQAQLVIDNTTQSPADLVQNVLVGTGVVVSNFKFNNSAANALVPQIQVGEFTGTTSIGISHGVILATGNAQLADGDNNNGGLTLPTGGTPGGGLGFLSTDPDLDLLSTLTLYDQAVLEFDFIPQGDSIKFKYVFGSEEYLEWVASGFNDVFGFFLSGPGISGPFSASGVNLAVIPGTSIPVSINTINDVTNASYYVDNGDGTTPAINVNIQYDGFTVIMVAKAKVQCGETYHIKLAITDAGDGALDSGVFLEAGSFSSDAVNVELVTTSGTDTIIEGCSQGGTFGFTRPASTDTLTIPISVSGNAINGVDYSPAIPTSITFLPGQDSVGISFTAVDDGVTEGTDSLIITIINVNTCGDTIISTATLYILDPQPLNVDLGPDMVLGCTGGAITLNANATGGYVPYTYSWSTGASTPSITHTITGSQSISVTVNGQCGTTDTDTINITIVTPTVMLWNSQVFTTYCPNDTVAIAADHVSGGSAPYTYLWSTTQTDSSILVSPNDTTSFTVTITDFCGQDTTITIPVNVRNPVPIDVNILNDTVCLTLDGLVTISPVLTGGNGNVSYTWFENTSGTITSQLSNGSILVSGGVTGQYIVTVIDECYMTDADTATVVIDACAPVIPNVFTPNGDGVNDNFVIVNLELHPNSRVVLFNRWGQIIFEDADYKNDWNGGDVSDGVYYYVLELTDGSSPDTYSGFVHLFRN